MNNVREAIAMLRIAGFCVIPYEDRLSVYEGDVRITIKVIDGKVDANTVYLLLTASIQRKEKAAV